MFYKFILWLLISTTVVVLGVPEPTLNLRTAADRFQSSVQQQTFQNVLLAIEQRLRNLDSIYSMQLSETLKSKMDQYHRKLESLDTKIIRLESMVMLNLDRISENISTKNYKDDAARSQIYRKLENVYDGLNHRINYMDRKFEISIDKIQNKVDTTLQRLERIEEDMVQRNADIESELSETLSILEDYKVSSANTDQVLLKITNMLNESTPNGPMAQVINMTMYNLMQDFTETITTKLDSIENSTETALDMAEETKTVLSAAKVELKEDFNAYANKVADMNVDVWKRNDIAEESLKTIETVTNLTRIEVQNGVRALILQIGKLSGKGITNNEKGSIESLKKNVNLSLEKIITNQELFLESCHRVQMDESQIESEISVMLGKLIDMLETQMTTVLKDLKNVDKTIKSHDSRIHRNLYQANTNIISLYEKTTQAHEFNEKELQDIKFYINSLFGFVQDVLPKTQGLNNTEDVLKNISLNISNITQLINTSNTNAAIKWNELESYFSDKTVNKKIVEPIKIGTDILLNEKFQQYIHLTDNINRSLTEIREIVTNLQRTLQSPNTTEIPKVEILKSKRICSQNYSHLIDVRAEGLVCNDTREHQTIDENLDKMKIQAEKEEEKLKKTILEIFGTPPAPHTTTQNLQDQSNANLTTMKKKCPPEWANLIDVRYDSNCTETKKKANPKQRRYRPKLTPRLQEEGSLVEEESEDDYADSTETTTETTTEITSTESSVTQSSDEVTNKI